jgi:hypothetical protein
MGHNIIESGATVYMRANGKPLPIIPKEIRQDLITFSKPYFEINAKKQRRVVTQKFRGRIFKQFRVSELMNLYPHVFDFIFQDNELLNTCKSILMCRRVMIQGSAFCVEANKPVQHVHRDNKLNNCLLLNLQVSLLEDGGITTYIKLGSNSYRTDQKDYTWNELDQPFLQASATLMDACCLHAGAANTSDEILIDKIFFMLWPHQDDIDIIDRDSFRECDLYNSLLAGNEEDLEQLMQLRRHQMRS